MVGATFGVPVLLTISGNYKVFVNTTGLPMGNRHVDFGEKATLRTGGLATPEIRSAYEQYRLNSDANAVPQMP